MSSQYALESGIAVQFLGTNLDPCRCLYSLQGLPAATSYGFSPRIGYRGYLGDNSLVTSFLDSESWALLSRTIDARLLDWNSESWRRTTGVDVIRLILRTVLIFEDLPSVAVACDLMLEPLAAYLGELPWCSVEWNFECILSSAKSIRPVVGGSFCSRLGHAQHMKGDIGVMNRVISEVTYSATPMVLEIGRPFYGVESVRWIPGGIWRINLPARKELYE